MRPDDLSTDMLMVQLLTIITVILLLHLKVVPFFRVQYDLLQVRRFLYGLDRDEYQILQDIELTAYDGNTGKREKGKEVEGEKDLGKIDYLVVSVYGVFALRFLNLEHTYNWLIGSEGEPNWELVTFNRLVLPFLGNRTKKEKELIENPVEPGMQFLAGVRKELKKRGYEGEPARVPFRPVIIIIPKIRGVDLRDRSQRCHILFAERLEATMDRYKTPVISKEGMQEIYEFLQEEK